MERLAAYKGKEPYLFISYAHKDFDEVHSIINEFARLGLHIWYDEGIDPGNEWPEEIAKAIDYSALFVVFVTKDSMASRNVISECYYALDNNKPFLAVFLENVPFTPGLALRASSTQAIMKYRMNDQDFYKKIIKTIEFKIPNVLVDEQPAMRNPQENSIRTLNKKAKAGFKKEILLGLIVIAFFLFVGFTASAIGSINQKLSQIKDSSIEVDALTSTDDTISEIEETLDIIIAESTAEESTVAAAESNKTKTTVAETTVPKTTVAETISTTTQAIIQETVEKSIGSVTTEFNGQTIVSSKNGIYITHYKESQYTLWVDRNEVIDKLKNFSFASVASFNDSTNTNDFQSWSKSEDGVHFYDDRYGYGIGAIDGFPHCVVFLYDNNKVLIEIIEFRNYRE